MHNSPVMKTVSKVVWVITALASINIGLMPMGYDFFTADFLIGNMNMLNLIRYIIGAAGVVSLIMCVMCCMKGDCGCEPRACSRCGAMTGCNCNK